MRALRALLIIGVILGGLFVAADRFAVGYAEDRAAGKIKASQGLVSEPDVSIKGFPFLTQAAAFELDEVEVRLDGVKASAEGHQVDVTEVEAELRDVKFDSNFSSGTAARATGSARISYEALAKAAPVGATVAYAGPERAAKGQVKISGSVDDLLARAGIAVPDALMRMVKGDRPLTVYSTVSIVDGKTVRLQAEDIPGLPGSFQKKVSKAVDYELRIDGLPRSITLDRATATEEGLRFSGTGTGVSLTG
ncbi:DUF2993 domain-containing protein [Streptomyces sannanensis]|uniref:DUF2993 domain-containing protein n=1 Tax=Streptomyces sannanensis TaxID=285536 RepID=A0ABP6SC77_9ACTN